MEYADDDKYRKIGSVRRLFEESNRDYYKPKVVDRDFAGEVNNYTKYISEGDKDEKLSPGEYLNMIRPDLRDLINRHKPIMLRMRIKCISTKRFIEARTMHPKSRQVNVYMGSDTENVIDTLFNTLLQNFYHIQETSNEWGSEFIPDSVELLQYELQKINIIRAESYIPSPDWRASKEATINPKNGKDIKFFQW